MSENGKTYSHESFSVKSLAKYELPIFLFMLLNSVITCAKDIFENFSYIRLNFILFVLSALTLSFVCAAFIRMSDTQSRPAVLISCVLVLSSLGLTVIPDPNLPREHYFIIIFFLCCTLFLICAQRLPFFYLLCAAVGIYACHRYALFSVFCLPVILIIFFFRLYSSSKAFRELFETLLQRIFKKSGNKKSGKSRKKSHYNKRKSVVDNSAILAYLCASSGVLMFLSCVFFTVRTLALSVSEQPLFKANALTLVFIIPIALCPAAVWSLALKRSVTSKPLRLPIHVICLLFSLIFSLAVIIFGGYRYSLSILLLPASVQIIAAAFLTSIGDSCVGDATLLCARLIKKHPIAALSALVILIRLSCAVIRFESSGLFS